MNIGSVRNKTDMRAHLMQVRNMSDVEAAETMTMLEAWSPGYCSKTDHTEIEFGEALRLSTIAKHVREVAAADERVKATTKTSPVEKFGNEAAKHMDMLSGVSKNLHGIAKIMAG